MRPSVPVSFSERDSPESDFENGVTAARTQSNVWKVRVVKSYAEAHNHLLIGEVFARDTVCVELNCRSFHFGRVVNSLKDVREGDLSIRIIPWSHIEIINVLPAEFNPGEAKLGLDGEGNILLKDRVYTCPVVTSRESRH